MKNRDTFRNAKRKPVINDFTYLLEMTLIPINIYRGCFTILRNLKYANSTKLCVFVVCLFRIWLKRYINLDIRIHKNYSHANCAFFGFKHPQLKVLIYQI